MTARPSGATAPWLIGACLSALTFALAVDAAAKPAPPLDRTRQGSGRMRVIVGLREPVTAEARLSLPQVAAQRRRLATRRQKLLKALGARRRLDGSLATPANVERIVPFETVPFLALSADAATLRRLLADPEVAGVQADLPARPALAESVPLIGADQAAVAGFTGKGQVIAILDSGVAKDHPMLKGKVVAEACYSSAVPDESASLCPDGADSSTAPGSAANCPTEIANCDHGTHVASIAAGSGAGLGGVARDAKIIAIQVFSRFDGRDFCGDAAPCALSYTSDQVRGLEQVYALRQRFKIAAANVSIAEGGSAAGCDGDHPALKAAIDQLRAAGIITVAAAGNDADEGKVGAPACVSTAVAVGSTTKEDEVSSFSNHAEQVDLLAPGETIHAAVPGGGFGYKSGTSMAAPYIAGAFAVLRQAKPTAGVDEIQAALACTGVPLERDGITRPRIALPPALDRLRSSAAGC